MAVSDELAKLWVDIGANTAPAQQSIGAFKGFLLNAAKGLGSSITAALGPVGAAFAGAFAIKEMVSAFMEGELAATKLEAALDSNGHAVDANMEKFDEFAQAVQAATRIDDEGAFALLTQGINLGLPTESVTEFSKAAIGLSQSIGIDTASAMQALAKEAQGVKSNLDRSIPALKGVEDQQQRLAIISAFAGKGLAQEEAQAQTLSGQITQLWNAVGNLAETLGGFLAPVIGFGVQLLKDLTGILQEVADAFSTAGEDTAALGELLRGYLLRNIRMVADVLIFIAPTVVNVFGTIVGWLNHAADAALDFWNRFSTFGVRLPEIFNQWLAAASEALAGIGEWFGWLGGSIDEFGHSAIDTVAGFVDNVGFTLLNLDLVFQEVGIFAKDFVAGLKDRFWYGIDVAGAFLSWLGENFVSVFSGVFLNSITILDNWAQNMGSIFKEAIDYIKSLGTDAFDPTLKAWDEGTKALSKPFKMPEMKDSFDAKEARKGLDGLWAERKKEWDAIQREDPLKPSLGAVDLPVVKAAVEDEKKKKEKADGPAAGTFSRLGSAWQNANSEAQKRAEKREEEKMKLMREANELQKKQLQAIEEINVGFV